MQFIRNIPIEKNSYLKLNKIIKVYLKKVMKIDPLLFQNFIEKN